MVEIFYLLVIFNVFMAIFGMLTLSNGDSLRRPSLGDTGGGIGGLTIFSGLLIAVVGSLASAYGVTYVIGTEKSPMSAIYIFGSLVFQGAYFAAWTTFWYPLVSNLPNEMDAIVIVLFALFTFLVESVFAFAFIQMTTGGWQGYK